MSIDIYLLSVPPDERRQLVTTLAYNLRNDQFPFVFRYRVDSVSCQVVLCDEQLMVLKLAVPTLSAKKLKNAENNLPLDNP